MRGRETTLEKRSDSNTAWRWWDCSSVATNENPSHIWYHLFATYKSFFSYSFNVQKLTIFWAIIKSKYMTLILTFQVHSFLWQVKWTGNTYQINNNCLEWLLRNLQRVVLTILIKGFSCTWSNWLRCWLLTVLGWEADACAASLARPGLTCQKSIL
jgi:hypothetical protein